MKAHVAVEDGFVDRADVRCFHGSPVSYTHLQEGRRIILEGENRLIAELYSMDENGEIFLAGRQALGSYSGLTGEWLEMCIRDRILKGELKPGERLMEIQLANKLGVSRTPVREAIRKLELEGLVLMIPRKGAEVAEITRQAVSYTHLSHWDSAPFRP